MADAVENEVAEEIKTETEEEGLEVEDPQVEDDAGSKEEDSKEPQPSISEEDAAFLELKKTGLSAAQIRSLAHKGWQAAKEEKEKAETKKDGEEDENSEGFLPVTKAELEEAMKNQKIQMRNESAAIMNQGKIDALLDTDRDASSSSITRSMIEGAMWKNVSNGMDIPTAFKSAKKEWKEYVGQVNKEYVTKKVEARATPGSSPSSSMSDYVPPEGMKHSADDFSSGKALDDALAFARQINPAVSR